MTEVHSFLGLQIIIESSYIGMHRLHEPLNSLVSGDNAKNKKKLVEWNKDCETAFQKLKQLCSKTPILAYADYKNPFSLQTDASEKGLGAVLYQVQDDGTSRVIAYASRTLYQV